jgi:hypothetical protein
VLASSPYRLGLALHHGIFLCDVMKQKADAMTLIKKAIAAAEIKMDQIED